MHARGSLGAFRQSFRDHRVDRSSVLFAAVTACVPRALPRFSIRLDSPVFTVRTMKGATILWTAPFLLAAIQAVMCANTTSSLDPKSFFADINGNLTKIVWAHAVNNQTLLKNALDSDKVMMLEADVVMGKVNASETTEIPVMAHPPTNTSDLSLEMFLKTVTEKNATKGVKLDFKSDEAFKAGKPILEKLANDIAFPVILNADILEGPVNANTTKPLNAKEFLKEAKSLANYTLSVGWTTRYGAAYNITEGSYTEEQVKNMLDTLKNESVSQAVSYAVRAGLAAGNSGVIESLMKNSPNSSTLTIWSHEGDDVNATVLSQLIKDVGVNKTYVDVPEELMKKLNLHSGASSISLGSTMTAVVLSTLLSTFIRRV